MTKNLKEKAISIKGKNYVLVSDRIIYFNDTYPNGAIKTELISQPSDSMVVIKATIIPDLAAPERLFTGYSQATWGDGMVNKTAALENAETSAVGRALAMMGIGVIDSVASVDEMKKATSNSPQPPNTSIENTRPCPIHKGQFLRKYISKKTGKPYFAHKLDDGSWCYGQEIHRANGDAIH